MIASPVCIPIGLEELPVWDRVMLVIDPGIAVGVLIRVLKVVRGSPGLLRFQNITSSTVQLYFNLLTYLRVTFSGSYVVCCTEVR